MINYSFYLPIRPPHSFVGKGEGEGEGGTEKKKKRVRPFDFKWEVEFLRRRACSDQEKQIKRSRCGEEGKRGGRVGRFIHAI